jgi:hypothetical protein
MGASGSKCPAKEVLQARFQGMILILNGSHVAVLGIRFVGSCPSSPSLRWPAVIKTSRKNTTLLATG